MKEHKEENIVKVTVEYDNGETEVFEGLDDAHKNVVVSIVTVDNLEDEEDPSGTIEARVNSSDFAIDMLIRQLREHMHERGDGGRVPTFDEFLEMLGM